MKSRAIKVADQGGHKRNTILLISGGQFKRSGNSPHVPRLTCITVPPASNVPHAYFTPCQLGARTGPTSGNRICPPCKWPASIKSKFQALRHPNWSGECESKIRREPFRAVRQVCMSAAGGNHGSSLPARTIFAFRCSNSIQRPPRSTRPKALSRSRSPFTSRGASRGFLARSRRPAANAIGPKWTVASRNSGDDPRYRR